MKALPPILLCFGLLLAQVARGEEMELGSWKVETTVTVAGQPPSPPSTAYPCLRDIYQLLNGDNNCPRGLTSVSGNHATVQVSCYLKEKHVQMDGTASLTITKTWVSGTVDLYMQVEGGDFVRTNTIIRAVRVGPCLR